MKDKPKNLEELIHQIEDRCYIVFDSDTKALIKEVAEATIEFVTPWQWRWRWLLK